WLVFTYFNYRHVPLTSIKFGLLLAKRQQFQNGAEFYFNGCCFVKHHSKLKPAATLVKHAQFCIGR
ncbi:hypothetical protein, partial [Serratia grimesii]|uniref:hypothetical protein n=1 Tax=Serratia grimesii TaxID=82995 RepID=UPI00242007E5